MYIYIYIYMYVCIPSLYIYITTWQVFRYFTKILLDNISLAIFLKLWNSLSEGTPLSICFRGLQLLFFRQLLAM